MSNIKLSNSDNLLGKNIQKARKLLGFKQYELAEKLNTSPGYISEIESGKKIPGSEFLFSLKRLFGVNLDDLFEEGIGDSGSQKAVTAVSEPPSDYLNTTLVMKILDEKTDIIRLLQDQIKDLKADKKTLEILINDQKGQIEELKAKLLSQEKDNNSF